MAESLVLSMETHKNHKPVGSDGRFVSSKRCSRQATRTTCIINSALQVFEQCTIIHKPGSPAASVDAPITMPHHGATRFRGSPRDTFLPFAGIVFRNNFSEVKRSGRRRSG
jgi:hypothetical protein